jgi:hypothetical protein
MPARLRISLGPVRLPRLHYGRAAEFIRDHPRRAPAARRSRPLFLPYAVGRKLNIVHLDAVRISKVLPEGDVLSAPVDFSRTPPFHHTGSYSTERPACAGENHTNWLPCWYAVTIYDDGSADLVEDPAAGEPVPVLRQGSYSQSVQLTSPRGTPTQRTGRVRVVPNPYPGMSSRVGLTGRAASYTAGRRRAV